MTRAEITPPRGFTLEGYPHYPRYNEGAHDPLYATCMYLADGEEVAMVTLDLLFFSKQYIAAVREAVSAECGMAGENIMISCTHTHSGPMTSGAIDLDTLEEGRVPDEKYVAFLIRTIADIIKEARENAFPASFGAGTAMCGAEQGIGGNRRMPGGPHDPLVSVLAIKDKSDNVRGMLVNYTLHPTFIHEWSNVCTADYPCYLKLQLEEMEPGSIVGFTQGTSGNQSSRYYRQGESYDEAERVGRTLGRAAHTVLDKCEWQDSLVIKTARKSIGLELRNFGTEEELTAQVARDEARYKELYAKYGQSKNREEYYLWQNANLKMLGSEDQLGYIRLQNRGIKIPILEDEAPAEVMVIRLGETLIVGLPGELFVEYGLYIKGMARFGMTVIHELAGCLPGYVYTPESLVTGGYETDASMLAEDFGMKLVSTAIELSKTVR